MEDNIDSTFDDVLTHGANGQSRLQVGRNYTNTKLLLVDQSKVLVKRNATTQSSGVLPKPKEVAISHHSVGWAACDHAGGHCHWDRLPQT